MFFFKPAWMSQKRDKAVKAVERQSDQAKLYEIAKKAPLEIVRAEAAQKLIDQSELSDIAQNDPSSIVRHYAITKLTDQQVLANIAVNEKDTSTRECAVKMLTDESRLLFIALNDKHPDICITAFKKITNQELIAQIASAPYSPAQKPALLVLKLDDSALLPQVYVEIAKNTGHNSAHDPKEILAVIDDDETLADIARHTRSHNIKKEAVLKISDQRVLANLVMAKCGTASLEAIARLTNQATLAEIIRECQSEYEIVGVAIEKLTDESLMDALIRDEELRTGYRVDIAIKMADQSHIQDFYISIGSDRRESARTRIRAVRKIQDEALAQGIYYDIAHNAEDWSERSDAIHEISDENILAEIAKSSSGKFKYAINLEFDNVDHAILTECDMREEIVRRLRSRDLLSDIAQHAPNKEVRARALRRLNELSGLK